MELEGRKKRGLLYDDSFSIVDPKENNENVMENGIASNEAIISVKTNAPTAAAPTASTAAENDDNDDKNDNNDDTIVDTIEEGVKKIKRRKKQFTGVEKKAYDLRKALEMCCREKNVDRALEVYQEIQADPELSMNLYMVQMLLSLCLNAPEDQTSHNYMDQAFDLYNTWKDTLRFDESCYTSIIKVCCKNGKASQGFELAQEVLAKNIGPKLRTFSPVMEAYSKLGDLKKTFEVYELIKKSDIEITEEEYIFLLNVSISAQSEEKFYSIMVEFMEDVLRPKLSSWHVLRKWFESPAGAKSLGEDQEWKCDTVTLNEDGFCDLTQECLVSVELSEEHESRLREQVHSLVCTNEKREKQWAQFQEFLEEHKAEPFDVIVDAANVGYFKQNYQGNGVMSYRQVEQLVAYYRDTLKKKVLIMLHIRRTEEELVPMKDRALVQSWKDSKHLYCCYPGNNDDWYWLYAAIFFGARTLVVTNDEMRDHHFQMLHLRSFVRWKERHQVRYELSGYQRKDITVYEPTKYSIRSQRIGRNWYFPNADGNAKEWLCIHQVAKVSTAHET